MMVVIPIAEHIWDIKYRLKDADGAPVDKSVADTWHRVAKALAVDESDSDHWSSVFANALTDFRFLPAGRILAGAGTERNVTLFNCFVMGTIPDDMGGIFEHLREAALTMQYGGGIGYDFSTLRPKGALVAGVGADASGPISFMDVWDAMCRTIMSAGHRRGAMMATLRCDHPDIEEFINAKQTAGRLAMFNLSVLATDAFMDAVRDDQPWPLTFDGVTYKTLAARDLWQQIMQATYAYAEPGALFIDRINAQNSLNYCETIFSTNPCGEQPLPPYGACLLGSVNLAALVEAPFSAEAHIDSQALADLVRTAVRMLDNAIDVSRFSLPQQQHEAIAKRRIGLGVTGLADALIMCGLRYGSDEAVSQTGDWLRILVREAYLASAHLAAEKGPFPLFERDAYLASPFVADLDDDVREAIGKHGLRNGLLTSIAPTGTISLLAGNVSSGIEPVYSFEHTRHILQPDGSRNSVEIADYAYRIFRDSFGNSALPDAFVDTGQLNPRDHLAMQAVAQKYIDSSISKTINCPEDIPFDDFQAIYRLAYETGCKGCTTYRPSAVRGAVLEPLVSDADASAAAPKTTTPEYGGESGGVVYMTQPLERPESLPGKTYKIRWPDSDHAIYITLNDIVRANRPVPFEVFINSKNMEHYAWTVALTRMISAVFRRGGDVSFVVEELKAVFDPRGGQWMDGHYVPSLLAAIGEVIEQHMVDIGFLPESHEERQRVLHEFSKAVGDPQVHISPRVGRACPKCGEFALIRQENCDVCTACDYSKCS
ncbi:MAG: adenosylcobalamin-dependent ribonucleoside-diphosphate reductase [Alphaproteobacteria bacterium]|nr:adenosylcobalamin-dependent ribonucleoside-diphosphate reductase [Alphaproteobacteria bacterium]